MKITRRLSSFASKSREASDLLDALVSKDISSDIYRSVMQQLGEKLAENILETKSIPDTNKIQVVCTVEDADFLAKGVIDYLQRYIDSSNIFLTCIWNSKVRDGRVSLSPILKIYDESKSLASDSDKTSIIVVKSIISGACVVKTNLLRVLSSVKDYDDVLVAAPVLLEGAQSRLQDEFPHQIASKFKFFWFATDDQKDGDNVVPGIGGSVYELLNLGDEVSKNRYLPDIVKSRRDKPQSNQPFYTPAM